MTELELGGCRVAIDSGITGNWYARAEAWGCECGHCRNFLAVARCGALPRPVAEILESLEIPAGKATYVCQIMSDSEGHLYQFSYRLAGTILHRPAEDGQSHSWGMVRCCHETYPYGAPGFPEPHFDLEFWVKLPWILEESDS